VRKTIPETMFTGREQARLSVLQNWVLENSVTEIEMNERQFWGFVSLQRVAEKPWTTFMGVCSMSATCPRSHRSVSGFSTREARAPYSDSAAAILIRRSCPKTVERSD
jgi:hypothetical protein